MPRQFFLSSKLFSWLTSSIYLNMTAQKVRFAVSTVNSHLVCFSGHLSAFLYCIIVFLDIMFGFLNSMFRFLDGRSESGLALDTSSNSLLSNNSLPLSNLSTYRECWIVDVFRISRIFQKPLKTWKIKKKKLRVIVLKMNFLHSLHVTHWVMNFQHVNSTH